MPIDHKELYINITNETELLIDSMTPQELREFREKLSHIAFTARVQLDAVNRKESKRTGFVAAVESDSFARNAIKNITERTKAMSKEDKQIAGLIKLGMTENEARELLARKVKG